MPTAACADEERIVVPGQVVDQPRVVDAVGVETEPRRRDGQRREVGEEGGYICLDSLDGPEGQRGIVYARPQRYGYQMVKPWWLGVVRILPRVQRGAEPRR